MELPLSQGLAQSQVDVDAIADFIAGVQKPNGEIPWSAGGKTDPWDHVESAMGLSVAGRLREAELAYRWMESTQLPDGSWWSATRDGVPEDKTRDSNVSSYIAVGVYHHFLITRRAPFSPPVMADAGGGDRLRRRTPGRYRRDPLGEERRGDCRPDGAPDRLQLGLYEPQVRPRHCLASGEKTFGLGIGQEEARRCDPLSSQPVQYDEGALFDGLVLPRSLRRRDRRRSPQADRPLLGEVRRPRMGGEVRLRSALGHDRGGLAN